MAYLRLPATATPARVPQRCVRSSSLPQTAACKLLAAGSHLLPPTLTDPPHNQLPRTSTYSHPPQSAHSRPDLGLPQVGGTGDLISSDFSIYVPPNATALKLATKLHEWNSMEIISKNCYLTLILNGVQINHAGPFTPNCYGSIALEAEGAPIQFRNIVVEA